MNQTTQRGPGRPPRAEQASERRVCFAVTDLEYEAMAQRAKAAKLTMSEYLRRAALPEA